MKQRRPKVCTRALTWTIRPQLGPLPGLVMPDALSQAMTCDAELASKTRGMAPELYVYKLTHDANAAPCVDADLLTSRSASR